MATFKVVLDLIASTGNAANGAGLFSSLSQLDRNDDARAREARLRDVLLDAEDGLFRSATETMREGASREAMHLCFVALRQSTSAGDEQQQLHALSQRLNQARLRLTGSILTFFKSCTTPLPPHAKDYTRLLLEELPHMSKEEVLSVVYPALSAFEAGLPCILLLLELLPLALRILLESRQGHPAEDPEEPQADHSTTRDSAVERLCRAPWPTEHAAKILGVMRELPLTPAQASLVVRTAVRQAASCELQAVPAVVYQLLLLAPGSTGPGARTAVASTSAASGAEGGRAQSSRRGSLRVQVMQGLVSIMDRLAAQAKHQVPTGAAAQAAPQAGPSGSGGSSGRSGSGAGAGRQQQGLPGEVLRQVMAVVLLHIANAARFDRFLVQEWLETLEARGLAAAMGTGTGAKAGAPSLEAAGQGAGPFVALLLCALCSPQQQQPLAGKALAAVKALLQQSFCTEEASSRGNWEGATAVQPGTSAQQAGQQLPAALVRAVRGSKQGSELVAQGALELGFALMETLGSAKLKAGVLGGGGALALAAGPGGGGGEADEVQRLVAIVAAELQWHSEQQLRRRQGRGARQQQGEQEEGSEAARQLEVAAGARVRCCLVGMNLLSALVEEHEGARAEVMRRLQTTLAIAVAPAAALPAVLLLGQLARRRARVLLQQLSHLQELLAGLPTLPCEVARQGLLLALWPALRLRRELQDATVMLLRKVMFSREVPSRLLAVGGFLHLILDQLRAAAAAAAPDAMAAGAGLSQAGCSQAGCSQSSLSQMGGLSGGCGVSLLSELTGFLRRALGQQAAVRSGVYAGLTKIVVADLGSLGSVAELLVPHMEQYLPQDKGGREAGPPLLLSKCTGCKDGEVQLVEHLPALLACLQSLVGLAESGSPGPEGAGGVGAVPGLQDSDPSEYFGLEALQRPQVAVRAAGSQAAFAQQEEVQVMVECYQAVRRQVVQCDAAGWGFDPKDDWWPGSTAGAAKQLQASCLLGCLEVLMQGEVDTAARSGWTEVGRQWMADAFALHRAVADMARNTRAPPAGGRKKAAGKENKLDGEEGMQASGGAPGENAGGSQDGATAGGAMAGTSGPKAPAGKGAAAGCRSHDYVKVGERRPAMSAACLAQLATEVAAAAAETANAPPQNGLGPLAQRPVFAAFVLRGCLNTFRHSSGPGAGADGHVLEALSGVFGDTTGGEGQPRRGSQSLLCAAGPALSACCAVISSGGQLGSEDDEVMEVEVVEPAAPAPSTTQATEAGGEGKKKGRPKKAKDGTAGAGKPPTGKKRAAPTDPDGTSAARVLLAARLIKLLLGAAHSTQQLSEALEPLPLPGATAPAHTQQLTGPAGQQQPPWPPSDGSWSGPLAVVVPRLLQLRTQLQRLMKAGAFEAAQLVVEAVLHTGCLLPQQLRSHLSDWVYNVVCRQRSPPVTHEGLAKAAVTTCCSLKVPPHDLGLLLSVAQDMQKVVGAADQATQTQHAALPIVHPDVAQQVAAAVLALLSEGLDGVERDMPRTVRLAMSAGGRQQALWRMAAGAALTRNDVAAYVRLGKLVDILAIVVNTRLGLDAVLQRQTLVVTHAYKLLTAVTKQATAMAAAAPKGASCPRDLVALVDLVNRDLTPVLYDVIKITQDLQDQQPDQHTRKRAAMIKKEQKSVPAMIFQIESWEKQLMALGKATGTNMLRAAKRTVHRGFNLKLKAQEGAEVQAEPAQAQDKPTKIKGKRAAEATQADGTAGRATKKTKSGTQKQQQRRRAEEEGEEGAADEQQQHNGGGGGPGEHWDEGAHRGGDGEFGAGGEAGGEAGEEEAGDGEEKYGQGGGEEDDGQEEEGMEYEDEEV